MKITDLSRARGIGANCYLIEIGPFRLLIDAGIDPKAIGIQATPQLDLLDGLPLDLAILTHCHLDHVGSLPLVVRRFPEVDIMCTRPSATLAPRMLRNSCNVMRRQRDELRIPEYPLYQFSEIETLETRLDPMPFKHPKVLHKDGEHLAITLHPAGHIAGAAGIEMEYKHRRIFFTGDVLFTNQAILDGADYPTGEFDTIVTETTHGAKPAIEGVFRESEVERLVQTIAHTWSHGGSVLIPAFALGRTQELLAIVLQAIEAKKLPRIPVYCAGLGMDLVDYLDAIARRTGLVKFRRAIVRKLKVQPIQGKLRPGQEPGARGLYILSSGMMVENTPSYAMAATLLAKHHNTLCFVGYCDPDTPGGKLLATAHGSNFVFEKLDYVTPVHARVERFDLSGHAGREEILEFLLKSNPRAVVLTHGDPEARTWFNQALAELAPKVAVTDPETGIPYQV